MAQRTLQLDFAGTSKVELFQTRFSTGCHNQPLLAVRGKTSGAYSNAGSFHFSTAVRALCILCVKSVLAEKSPPSPTLPIILGFRGSIVASLDYALTKQPAWLIDMFGCDTSGRPMGQRLLSRTNSHLKRPGPVAIGLNTRALSAKNIHIFWNEQRVEDVQTLKTLLSLLGESKTTAHPESTLRTLLDKLAA
jgi:hypothetical protein